ncbi:phospholipase A2 inhibitor and Ly6/PLAUR domain-containing protein [Anolis carolinensis]|uniref:phospholipase A2 inhibitor and Ly6/PLAUR domain-containing protein n=1 Tax=Anolis carolinensis TaxID=28377 RepID=UPI0002039785|nr:PREDICTED: phospholipase A2 inhibitor and Ly6/PLAUR domain-containing protein-like [Anolis carolinensis]|eukprot:XP_016849357.1 PREDICTED: phospholipase A2 inhibitor and Ly6/PLAUR domain-containing protein-like [Anolis carolinensis]
MSASLGLGLLLAFLARGTALQCEVCTGLGQNCTGELETCPPNHDFCATTMFATEREEIKVHGLVKNCVPFAVCQTGSADINLGKKGRSRTSVFCCQGDACNTASSAELPLVDTKLNGLRCPACYASFSESCGDDTVDCVGSESHCLDLAGYVYTGETSEKVAMKGCATLAVCDATIGGAATFTGVSSAITKLECRAATNIASRTPEATGLFISVIAGLLMIQFSS